MRKTRFRSFPVLMITLAFFVGLVYFMINLVIHSSEWASMPYNGHLSESDTLEMTGTITDRNGVILAKTENGERIYNEDEDIRRACLHVVGDNSVNISTAIQTLYRSELSGYNFILGLGSPDFMKTSSDIRLTIDSEVQKAAYKAMGNYKGAVIVYNYKTGEIICMVSTPTYDPENIPEDIDTNSDYEGAYINRTISASYPPGSTFKLITASAALEKDENNEHREYDCIGYTEIGGKTVNCYSVSGHVDMKDALMNSCNAYFAELTVDIGKDSMQKQAEKMGFNSSWRFDGIETVKSSYDVSKADENSLAWSGIGQYTVLESPINMAIRSSAIANGGNSVTPKLIMNIDTLFGGSLKQSDNSPSKTMMSAETADKIKDMMDYTVENYYGKSYFSNYLDVCAKTGTAEISDDGISHAWVTGFTKDEDCPLAFSVIVEKGESGYQVAIPIAGTVLDAAAESLGAA